MSTSVDARLAPPLWRRMACFVYEGVLLFGVLMIAGYLFSSLTQQRHALVGRHALQAFLFIVLGIYFAWFWSRSGQTVAMKAWHIRLVTIQGQPVSQPRALARYLLSWLWFVPALVALSLAGLGSPAAMFGLLFVGVVVYAALSRLHPQRQFWHDAVCGTQLVTQLPVARRAEGSGQHNPAP
ncbi:MAG: membrane protein [Methylibium sp. NZG]|nr:MAG: membrane protein [Methylibium sp. NZG]